VTRRPLLSLFSPHIVPMLVRSTLAGTVWMLQLSVELKVDLTH